MSTPYLRVLSALAVLAGFLLLMSLGTWQYGRYQEKLELERALAERKDDAPERITAVSALRDRGALNYAPVVLRGVLVHKQTLLFTHRTFDGRPGFWVATPLALADGGSLLAHRGWLPVREGEEIARKMREQTSVEEQEFRGIVHVLGQNIPDADARALIERGELSLSGELTMWDSYDVEAIQGLMDGPVPEAPMVLVLDKTHSGSPLPIATTAHVTKPFLTSDRHLGYAAFWYVTGVALLAMYIAGTLGWIRSGRGGAARGDPPDDA
ncbi:MAG: SURF1 family protein [Myxococcota bacterium]